MAKYYPLQAYLRRQKDEELELSFREIENLIGCFLPKAAAIASWWSEGDSPPLKPSVQHKAWGDAGFRAELLGARERVRFSRTTA